MKQFFILAILFFSNLFTFAHDAHYEHVEYKNWHLQREHKVIRASFNLFKNNSVYLEDEQNQLLVTSINNLSADEQNWVLHRQRKITELNHHNPGLHEHYSWLHTLYHWRYYLLVVLALMIIYPMYRIRKVHPKYLIPVPLGVLMMLLSSDTINYVKRTRSATNPAFIDSAFVPFKPQVHTYYDANYFYVESQGIPTTHTMMVGISNHGWQQQVPIPQCYVDTNAWPIPLNPVMAASPIPIDSIHFTRGAIAIAVNGVPIFNPHTNTGVDAYLDGQLDDYGGHCGRADDYHYHTAPLHLYNHTSSSLPIAFALDGFPVYGLLEPDGSPLQSLDANHGHALSNIVQGMYHYHGSTTSPYMIAKFAGQVTEDSTHQLIPQAHAKPVRPGLTPLNGALITNCTANSTNNGYTIVYTLGGQTDSIVYSWTSSGVYTFKFYVTGNGISSDSIYNGHPTCQVPNLLTQLTRQENLELYPNPFSNKFYITLPENMGSGHCQIFNAQGKLVLENYFEHKQKLELNMSSYPNGNYFILVVPQNGKVLSSKIIKYEN